MTATIEPSTPAGDLQRALRVLSVLVDALPGHNLLDTSRTAADIFALMRRELPDLRPAELSAAASFAKVAGKRLASIAHRMRDARKRPRRAELAALASAEAGPVRSDETDEERIARVTARLMRGGEFATSAYKGGPPRARIMRVCRWSAIAN